MSTTTNDIERKTCDADRGNCSECAHWIASWRGLNHPGTCGMDGGPSRQNWTCGDFQPREQAKEGER